MSFMLATEALALPVGPVASGAMAFMLLGIGITAATSGPNRPGMMLGCGGGGT